MNDCNESEESSVQNGLLETMALFVDFTQTTSRIRRLNFSILRPDEYPVFDKRVRDTLWLWRMGRDGATVGDCIIEGESVLVTLRKDRLTTKNFNMSDFEAFFNSYFNKEDIFDLNVAFKKADGVDEGHSMAVWLKTYAR